MDEPRLTDSTCGTVRIGGDLTVRRLGFGAMRLTGPGVWGRSDDPGNVRAVLRRVVDLGVNLIDTADAYGPEVNEEDIADALYPYPDDLVIATKGGLVRQGPGKWSPVGRPEHLRAACEGSLARLRVDVIDLYQLHRPDPDVPFAESVGALADLRAEGKIRHVGLSNVSVEQLTEAQAIVPIASVQNRYNLADRVHEPVLAACEAADIAFLPFFPLAAGDFDAAVAALTEIGADLGVDHRAVALAWLLERSPVVAPIPGTSSLEHLEANVAAASLRLTQAQIDRLDAYSPSVSKKLEALSKGLSVQGRTKVKEASSAFRRLWRRVFDR